VLRAQEGSNAATHLVGAKIFSYLTAGALETAFARVGTDGTVGGSGGTGLTPSVENASSRVYDFRDYGAKFDGATDDSTALNAGQQGSSTTEGPNGVSRIVANSLAFKKSRQHIRGQGMFASTLQAVNPTSLAELISQDVSGYASHVIIEDWTIDGALNTWDNAVLAAYGPNIGRLEINRVRFVNGGWSSLIDAGYASEIIVRDCVAEGRGLGQQADSNFLTGTNKDLEVVIAERNRLRWLGAGFLLGTESLAYQAHVELRDNYIDLGWWFLKSLASGSGGTVTYTSTSVIDSGANFTGAGIQDSYTVRALTPRHTGTITGGQGNWLVDSSANFTTAGVLRGEIVRSGTAFAIVGAVESGALHVEEWLDQTTYQPVLPPAGGAAYTVYETRLGLVSNVTATTLTVDQGGNSGWYDLTGARTTPAAGTLYEVCGNTSYPIQLSQTCDAPKVEGGIIRRGWADLIGLEGCSRPQVLGVLLEDGQDTGVTPDNGTTGGIVAGCTIRHCGGQAITAYNWTDGILGPNQYDDNTWGNNSGAVAQVGLDSCTRVQVLGGKARSLGGGQSPIGLALKGTSAGCKILGFEAREHSFADIWVRSAVAAAANEILDPNSDAVIVYEGTANGQLLRVKGTGVPTLIASPGSTFKRTDGAAGSTLYVKESGNDDTGWDAMGGGAALAYGERVEYSAVTSAPTCTPGGAVTVFTGSPSITLPNDGHTYRVVLNAPYASASAAATIYVAIGDSAAFAGWYKASSLAFLSSGDNVGPINLSKDIVGSGQTIKVYGYGSGATITLDADFGHGGGGTGPVELSAILVAA
jgi:hypothetical protein